MHAKSLQACPTLWDPMDHSLPGSSVHGMSLPQKSSMKKKIINDSFHLQNKILTHQHGRDFSSVALVLSVNIPSLTICTPAIPDTGNMAHMLAECWVLLPSSSYLNYLHSLLYYPRLLQTHFKSQHTLMFPQKPLLNPPPSQLVPFLHCLVTCTNTFHSVHHIWL